jgi:hypothetical protein
MGGFFLAAPLIHPDCCRRSLPTVLDIAIVGSAERANCAVIGWAGWLFASSLIALVSSKLALAL